MSSNSTDDKAIAAVERALPNPNRPRLSDRDEARLAPIDRASALAYTEAELATERLAEIVSDGVPDNELWSDTTLVNVIQELRALERAGKASDDDPERDP